MEEHTNKIAIEVLDAEYGDYHYNQWHYDSEYKMIVKAIELSKVRDKKPIELRKQEFKNNTLKHSKYGEIMLDEFIDYWTEHNENGRKMKFEMQKTFNIDLRLKQWYRRSNKPSNGVNQAWKHNV